VDWEDAFANMNDMGGSREMRVWIMVVIISGRLIGQNRDPKLVTGTFQGYPLRV
jgi:hypothetical protein